MKKILQKQLKRQAKTMSNLKHVGRLKSTRRKCVIPYRTLPNDPYHCLAVFTDSLPSDEHESLMRLVESAAGQQAVVFAEAMSRNYLQDGRNMLTGFHQTGRLEKIATSSIEMTPSINNSIVLSELNEIIANQLGVALEDLAVKASTPTNSEQAVVNDSVMDIVEESNTISNDALSDDDLARKYRSDADRLSKEAAELRRMAEDLVPAKKKTVSKVKSTAKKKESA